MENVNVKLYVCTANEYDFFLHLKMIDKLSIDSKYEWNARDFIISRSFNKEYLMIEVLLPYVLYLKFMKSFYENGGNFV